MAVIESLLHALVWWLALTAITATGWLLIARNTRQFEDRGWAVAKQLTVIALAFVVWIAGHAAPLFQPAVVRSLVFGVIVLALIARRKSARLDRSSLREILSSEARFALPFAFYVAMRGFSHDVIGLEKFMDYGFAASAMRAETLPVPDPWYAGEPINYYYFGHFVTAFLCKLTGTPLAYGYNLMLASVFGSVFQLGYVLVIELARSVTPVVRATMAYVGAIWLTVGGNVHGFYYGFIRPWLVDLKVLAPPRQAFLLSDPTRFVGWDPPTEDKLIHEFPAYAFYVGDLHAHLINLPSVLLLCALLLGWLRSREPEYPLRATAPSREAGFNWLRRAFAFRGADRFFLIAAGWLVGVFAMANSWDALMYGALLFGLSTVLFARSINSGVLAVQRATADGLLVGFACAVGALPFFANFHLHGEGFLQTYSHTPLWQWLVLYGLHSALALTGCVLALRMRSNVRRPEQLLLWMLSAFAIVFAIVPEFFYLKDIYGGPFYRGNTAFKFGFQAFTLLTVCACAGVAIAIDTTRAYVPRAAIAIVLEIALVPPLYYAWFVLQGGFGVWREREWTLDGERFLARNYPEDLAVSNWLRGQTLANASLIEAVGDSYSYAARISTASGVPAVLGWPVHEQLWRGSDPSVWKRRDDVNALYEAKSTQEALRVIERYRPRWLILGRFERERYGDKLDANLVTSLGTVVFRSGDTVIIDVKDGTTSMAEVSRSTVDDRK